MLRVRNRRGIAATEFALAALAIVPIIMGAADVAGMLRVKLRLDSAAQQVGHVVAQCNTVSAPGDTSQFWAEAQKLLDGVTVLNASGGAVIVSVAYRENGANKVAWQIRTGNTAHASAIGAAGGTATLPAGFAPPGEHNIIVTEVFAPVKALMLNGKVVGSPTGETLKATTLTVSRALDPVRLRQPLTANSQMACTA